MPFLCLNQIVIWLKRATGIGYKKFPPLPKTMVVDPRAADPIKRKSDVVVREIERLERELRRRGIHHYSTSRHDE
jgi:hypothetical protein